MTAAHVAVRSARTAAFWRSSDKSCRSGGSGEGWQPGQRVAGLSALIGSMLMSSQRGCKRTVGGRGGWHQLIGARRTGHRGSADDATELESSGVMLPAPVLDVRVRGQDDVITELVEFVSGPDGPVRVLAGMVRRYRGTVNGVRVAHTPLILDTESWFLRTPATTGLAHACALVRGRTIAEVG